MTEQQQSFFLTHFRSTCWGIATFWRDGRKGTWFFAGTQEFLFSDHWKKGIWKGIPFFWQDSWRNSPGFLELESQIKGIQKGMNNLGFGWWQSVIRNWHLASGTILAGISFLPITMAYDTPGHPGHSQCVVTQAIFRGEHRSRRGRRTTPDNYNGAAIKEWCMSSLWKHHNCCSCSHWNIAKMHLALPPPATKVTNLAPPNNQLVAKRVCPRRLMTFLLYASSCLHLPQYFW